jgi:hypothetical protein
LLFVAGTDPARACETGLSLRGTVSKPRAGGVESRANQHLRVEGCRFAGPFRAAAVQVEGSLVEAEFAANRFDAGTVGVALRKPTAADQQQSLVLRGNTFTALGGAAISLESGAYDAQVAARCRLEVVENHFGLSHPNVLHVGDGTVPPWLTAERNTRDPAAPEPKLPGLPTAVRKGP